MKFTKTKDKKPELKSEWKSGFESSNVLLIGYYAINKGYEIAKYEKDNDGNWEQWCCYPHNNAIEEPDYWMEIEPIKE